MSAEYQKGRYDELVERHKELLDLYTRLVWQMQTSQLTSGPGFHGAEVNVYAGTRVDPKAIAWSLGFASAVFRFWLIISVFFQWLLGLLLSCSVLFWDCLYIS